MLFERSDRNRSEDIEFSFSIIDKSNFNRDVRAELLRPCRDFCVVILVDRFYTILFI